MFVNKDGDLLDLDKLGTRLVRPAIRTIGVTWHGWHAFRRGIASNLISMGVNEKIVQRILRRSKPHVTKECCIKAFDPRRHRGHEEDGGDDLRAQKLT